MSPRASERWWQAAWLALCIGPVWAAPAAPAASAPGRQVALGESFELRVGESVGIKRMRLSVLAVTDDSRCPKGEQCIVAGDATIRLQWQAGDGASRRLALRAVAPEANHAVAFGHEVRVLGLAPQPLSGRPLQASDYVVTLRVCPVESTGRPAAEPPADSGEVAR
jgi:hypothetical protein